MKRKAAPSSARPVASPHRRSRIAVPLGLALAALALSACGSQPAVADSQSPLLQSGASWPGGIVPVCYNPLVGNEQTLVDKARGILNSQGWAAVANVSFTNWGPCLGLGGGYVRLSFQSGSNGNTSWLGWNPSGITDVTLTNEGIDQHFTYEVLHEFGHVLGFAHEQQRLDNWNGSTEVYCSNNQPGQTTSAGDYDTPYYDTQSVMSYCTGFPMALSPGDVAGAQLAYGKKTPIALGQNSSSNAVGRSPDNLDQFYVRTDGSVWTSYWYTGMQAWPWPSFQLPNSGPGTAPAGAPIAAVARTAYNLDIFYVGNDRAIHTSAWSATGGWSSSTLPGTAGLARPSAQIAAVASTPGTIQVFFAGINGNMYWSQYSAQCGSSWTLCGWQNPVVVDWATPPGAALSAVARTPDHLDVFYLGDEGLPHDASCSGFGAGAGTQCRTFLFDSRIPTISNCVGPVGGGIAAAARGEFNLDVFWVSKANTVCTNGWTPSGGWSSTTLGSAGAAPAGGMLAAVTRTPDNLDVFFLGGNGTGDIYDVAWSSSSGWNMSRLGSTIGDFGVKGAAMGATSRSSDHLDVFARGIPYFGSGETITTAWWATGSTGFSLYQTNYY